MMNRIAVTVLGLVLMAMTASAQSSGQVELPKKANARTTTEVNAAEPFDGASVEKMASQCVTLETELGAIEIAFMPEAAPEAVRNFSTCRLRARSTPRRLVVR
jgi:hypothetical protein